MNHLNANLLHHDTVFSEHSESNPDTAKNIPRPKFSFFRTRNRKIPPTASPGTRPSPAVTETSPLPLPSPPACCAPPRFPAAKAAAGPPERPFTPPPQPHNSPAVTETSPPPRSSSPACYAPPRFPAAKAADGPPECPFTPPQPHSLPRRDRDVSAASVILSGLPCSAPIPSRKSRSRTTGMPFHSPAAAHFPRRDRDVSAAPVTLLPRLCHPRTCPKRLAGRDEIEIFNRNILRK